VLPSGLVRARAIYKRGLAYGKLKEYQQAIQDFDRVIELDPHFATAYYNRGAAHLLTNISQARADCERSYELDAAAISRAWMIKWDWLEKDRPAVFVEYVKPLLLWYGV